MSTRDIVGQHRTGHCCTWRQHTRDDSRGLGSEVTNTRSSRDAMRSSKKSCRGHKFRSPLLRTLCRCCSSLRKPLLVTALQLTTGRRGSNPYHCSTTWQPLEHSCHTDGRGSRHSDWGWGRRTARSASSNPSSRIRLLSEKRLPKSSRSEGGAGISEVSACSAPASCHI